MILGQRNFLDETCFHRYAVCISVCIVLTFLMTSFRKMISVNFIVRSSSLVPDFKSLTTEGLIHKGGTKSRVRIKSEGFPASGFIRSRGTSSAGIRLNKFRTTKGFKFSYGEEKRRMERHGNFPQSGQGFTSPCSPPHPPLNSELTICTDRNFCW